MTDFHNIGKSTQVPARSIGSFDIGGRRIAVANVEGSYFAIDDRCTCVAPFTGHVDETSSDGHHHVGDFGSLSAGVLDGDTVTCPLHRTAFSVRTGRPLSGFGESPVNTFEVRVEQGELEVAEMSDAERHFWGDPGNKERP